MPKKIFYSIIGVLSNFILFNSNAFAQVPNIFQSYVVRGSLETTFSAFNTIALICNSTAFKALILPFWGFSLFFVVGSFFLGVFKNGEKEGSHGIIYNFAMLIIGSLIATSFVFKKSDFLIIDKKVNQQKVVADLPDIFCLVAGGMSFFREGFLEIIEGSSSTLSSEFSYNNNSNGDMFELMLDAFKAPVNVDEEIKEETLNFIKDCVFFAIDDNVIKVKDLYYTSDYLTVFEKAVENGRGDIFFTKDYNGNSLSCSSLLTQMKVEYLSTFVDDMHGQPWYKFALKNSCTSFLKDTQKVNEHTNLDILLTKCKENIQDFNNKIFTGSLSTSSFFRQRMVADILAFSMSESNSNMFHHTKTQASLDEHSKNQSILFHSTNWLPKSKMLMFTAYIVIFPFLILFLVTPFMKQILSFIIGTFIFFLAWELCDISLYYQAMNAVGNTIPSIKDGTISLGNFIMGNNELVQVVSTFGQYKIIAMTTAGIFASIVTKAGNAIAHSVSRKGIELSQVASHATTGLDERSSHTARAMRSSSGTARELQETSIWSHSESAYYQGRTQTLSAGHDIANLGGGSAFHASTRKAQANAYDSMSKTLQNETLQNYYASQGRSVQEGTSKMAYKEGADRLNTADADINRAHQDGETYDSFSKDKATTRADKDKGVIEGLKETYNAGIQSGRISSDTNFHDWVKNLSRKENVLKNVGAEAKYDTIQKEANNSATADLAYDLIRGKTADDIGGFRGVEAISAQTGLNRAELMETMKTFQHGNQFKTADEFLDRMVKDGVKFKDEDGNYRHLTFANKAEASLYLGELTGAYKSGTMESTSNYQRLLGEGDATKQNALARSLFYRGQEAYFETEFGKNTNEYLENMQKMQAIAFIGTGETDAKIIEQLKQAHSNPEESQYLQDGVILKPRSYTEDQAKNIIANSDVFTEKDIDTLTGGKTSLVAKFDEDGNINFTNIQSDKSSGLKEGITYDKKYDGIGLAVVDGKATSIIEKSIEGEKSNFTFNKGASDAQIIQLSNYLSSFSSAKVNGSTGNSFKMGLDGKLQYFAEGSIGTPGLAGQIFGLEAKSGLKGNIGFSGSVGADGAEHYINEYNKNYDKIKNIFNNEIATGNKEGFTKTQIAQNIENKMQDLIDKEKSMAHIQKGVIGADRLNEIKDNIKNKSDKPDEPTNTKSKDTFSHPRFRF